MAQIKLATTQIYCVDERHGSPCRQPCKACKAEGCDPQARVEATDTVEAARAAGWTEEYIAEMPR